MFERYRRMLDRLANPIFLAFWARNIYERDIGRNSARILRILANHDYVRGLDQIVEFGFVDSHDLVATIDELAGNPSIVTAVARLIELNRRYFGGTERDYSL